MYSSFDYLTAEILNEFEERLFELYIKIEKNYSKKIWIENELIFVDDIKKIEDSIEFLGSFFNYPNNWQTSKKWNLTEKNNISYIDLNRWNNNLNVIKNEFDKVEFNYDNNLDDREEVIQ